MKKLDIAISKIKENNETFLGKNYMYCNKCPEDYGMSDLAECVDGNSKCSCKECWEEEVKIDPGGMI